ncbi:MAG: S16 family serine protease [Candidatus Woesearchaeota archaeon]
MSKKLFLILAMLALMPIALANSGSMTLLTVGTSGNQTFGGTADLYLEIAPGSGRIFIDSFPLTQLDTQISTRYAKEIACNYSETDCDSIDFFYTIRARSSLVGGPSAGAAMAILTISLIEGIELDPKTVMTGTINSGGLIGPVSGIEEKAIAARQRGFENIVIPKWANANISVDDINIVEVSTIEEALSQFTGIHHQRPFYELEIPQMYKDIMRGVATDLCDSTNQLLEQNSLNNSRNNYDLALSALERGDYYSAASFCFTANAALRNSINFDLSRDELVLKYEEISANLNQAIKETNARQLNTISDLETYVIVKERLYEVDSLLENKNASLSNLGYIEERFLSAIAWSSFFDFESRDIMLDDVFLRDACLTKIAEAEERINYFEFIFGVSSDSRSELESARDLHSAEDFAFCIFKATKVKADTNSMILSGMVSSDLLSELALEKLNLAYNFVASSKDFPILAYSYLNYATSLLESNPRSTIIFTEYAMEFSNLDMYFPESKKETFVFEDYLKRNNEFVLGFIFGLLFGLLVVGYQFAKFKYENSTKKRDNKPRKISKRNPPRKKR